MSFTQLWEVGVLEAGFAREIARRAGLRNRLVREYDEIDAEKLFTGMQAAARDIPTHLERILEYAERASGG